MAIVSKRLSNLTLVLKYWSQGEFTSALSTMTMTSDQSTVMDVFSSTFADDISTDLLNLDQVVTALALALGLVQAKYDSYVQVGLRSIQNIYRHFGEVLVFLTS